MQVLRSDLGATELEILKVEPSGLWFKSSRAGVRGGRGELGLVVGAGWRGGGGGSSGSPERPLLGSDVRSLSLRGRQVLGELGPSGRPRGLAQSPSAPPGGLRSRGPAYARGPAAAAGAGDVALRGAAAGPTCHPLPFPRLFGAPTSERGQVQRLPLFSLPLPSLGLLSPSVVVPAPASSSAPAAAAASPPAPPGAEFCRRGAVTALPSESALFFSGEKKKVVVMRTGLSGD
ncbi:uncharacterized protein C11orf96-like [Cervus elaphus]|uniref:uncharacterized protein C11orf96-like n=1 Tax=Cervus canadensis TaxID=1574408 RepID=UPI001C9E3CD3|nr:uncharacterized protein C11orf96-like [Cervus canadensis]XP_043738759.1 uncharacterized protein C11orf96-like [Cervus elaphus]